MKTKATPTSRTRRPTQADVARLAGVSQPTVSQVLNNNTAIAVPDETRQRVLDAIGTLGYVPDRMARSLRTRRTYTLASIIPDITNPFYPAFQRGIQDGADLHGYDLIMYNTDGIAEKEHKALHSLQQGRVDGIIAVFFHVRVPDLRVLLDQGIAVVRLEAMPQEVGALPLDTLYVDNIAAARTAVTHLIQQGHSHIGMLAGQLGPQQPRVLGYREALAAHGIPSDERLIRSSEFTREGGYDAMRALLENVPSLTAVFAANDLIAIGALNALHEARVRVPEDIAVVGFDNIPSAELVSPALTTITQFQERLGQRAAQLIFERLGGNVAVGGRCEEMPYQLVIRESA